MTTTKKKTRRSTHGDRIYQHALETVFPLPKHPDPQRIGGLLTGVATALDAVGYDYGQDEEDSGS